MNSKLFFILLTLLIPSFFSCKKSTVSQQFNIGDQANGGVIIYLDASGDHGLVCASVDQGSNAKFSDAIVNPWPYWRSYGQFTDSTIGMGNASTDSIILKYGNSGNIAATCRNYHAGGFSDWYLPSIDELREIYRNKAFISGLYSVDYWSSTSFASSNFPYTVRILNMGTGNVTTTCTQCVGTYNNTISWWDPVPTANLRAVRKF